MAARRRARPLVGGIVLQLGWILAGCGDGEEGSCIEPVPVTGQQESPRGDPPYYPDERTAPANDLEWQRCALITGGPDRAAECARIDVPVRWSEPDGDQIELFVKRYRAAPRPRGQLWLLAGGPGAAGADFEHQTYDDPRDGFYPTFAEIAPELEVYLLDHRGTGRSSRLGCPAQEDPDSDGASSITDGEWGACLEAVQDAWGASLDGFNTTEAARDLGEIVSRTRHGDEAVFVYGVSYGTYWALRYLHLYPEQAAGVVLDSICAPGECDVMLDYDAGFDEVGHALLDLCSEDPSCAGQFPDGGPLAALDAVRAAAIRDECGFGLEPADVRLLLGLMLRSWPIRDLVPAVIARLRACDEAALQRLLLTLVDVPETAGDEMFSDVLNRHVALSELARRPAPTVEEVETFVDGLDFSLDVGPHFARLAEAGWPTYDRDAWADELPDTTVPLLLLNGTLDPQTVERRTRRTAAHFTGADQQYVAVPYATHSVLDQSPLELAPDGTLATCGQDLIAQFLAAPTTRVDTSCTQDVIAPNFANPELARVVLGTANPFSQSVPAELRPLAAGTQGGSYRQAIRSAAKWPPLRFW